MSLLDRWHRRWLRQHLPLLRELQTAVRKDEIARAGRVLDWIGVARGMPVSERVLWLAIDMAGRQGYSLDEAERLARKAAGPSVQLLAETVQTKREEGAADG